MRSSLGLALMVVLAACSSQWSKPGASPSKAAQDLSECRHTAEIANRRDSDIDTDILATRGPDWERMGVLQTKRDDYAESNRVRSGDIVDRCMIDKGYTSG